MITIVLNMFKDPRATNNIKVDATMSATGDSAASSFCASHSVNNSVDMKTAIDNLISLTASSLNETTHMQDCQEILTKISDLSISGALQEKDKEIERLKSEIARKDNETAALRRDAERIQREHRDYMQRVQAAAKALQTGQLDVTIPLEPIAPTNPSLDMTLIDGGKTVVLNATLLNNAIKNKEKLESRSCSKCGNVVIAPASVSDLDIVCARCHPQDATTVAPLSGSSPF